MCRVTYGGVVERGCLWLEGEGSSSEKGVNTTARAFWMGKNLDVLEHGNYMKKFVWGELNLFIMEWWKLLECGAPLKVNHLDNPLDGIRMTCLSCSY